MSPTAPLYSCGCVRTPESLVCSQTMVVWLPQWSFYTIGPPWSHIYFRFDSALAHSRTSTPIGAEVAVSNVRTMAGVPSAYLRVFIGAVQSLYVTQRLFSHISTCSLGAWLHCRTFSDRPRLSPTTCASPTSLMPSALHCILPTLQHQTFRDIIWCITECPIVR